MAPLVYRRAPRLAPSNVAEQPRRPKQALKLAMLVFVQYALLAMDIRFVADANYPGIAVVNVCIAVNTWYLTRGIIEARTVVDRLCFVAGGTAGALLAVLAT